MISPLWSATLTAVGVVGLFFTMRKSIVGPMIGLVVQTLWIAYAIASYQLPFIGSALAYGAVNTYGLVRWRKQTPGIPHTNVTDGKHEVVSGGQDETKRKTSTTWLGRLDGR